MQETKWTKAPHDWCIMLPLSQRVQPGVYTLMAMSRYRDALVRHALPAEPCVYPPLIPEILTSCFDVLILPPLPFRTAKPLTQDAFQVVPVFLQKRCAYPELCNNHNGPGALLLTPRLDAQTCFAKLFADIGTQEDVRRADLAALLAAGPPPPAQVTAKHVQALRFDLKAETLSHAAGLTAHTAIVLFGSSKFLGRDELGHSRTTVRLTRSCGVTVLAGPPDPYGVIGMVQTIYCYYFTAHSTTWTLDPEVYPFDEHHGGDPPA